MVVDWTHPCWSARVSIIICMRQTTIRVAPLLLQQTDWLCLFDRCTVGRVFKPDMQNFIDCVAWRQLGSWEQRTMVPISGDVAHKCLHAIFALFHFISHDDIGACDCTLFFSME